MFSNLLILVPQCGQREVGSISHCREQVIWIREVRDLLTVAQPKSDRAVIQTPDSYTPSYSDSSF